MAVVEIIKDECHNRSCVLNTQLSPNGLELVVSLLNADDNFFDSIIFYEAVLSVVKNSQKFSDLIIDFKYARSPNNQYLRTNGLRNLVEFKKYLRSTRGVSFINYDNSFVEELDLLGVKSLFEYGGVSYE